MAKLKTCPECGMYASHHALCPNHPGDEEPADAEADADHEPDADLAYRYRPPTPLTNTLENDEHHVP